MTIEISVAIVISVLSLSFSVYKGLKDSKRTDEQDVEERAAEISQINTKLDFINTTTQESKERLFSLVEKVDEHGERITKVEESCKSAHHRIDTLENRINKEGK